MASIGLQVTRLRDVAKVLVSSVYTVLYGRFCTYYDYYYYYYYYYYY